MELEVNQMIEKKQNKIKWFFAKAVQQKQLMLIGIPFLIYTIIFAYIPLSGWIMAFTDFKPGKGLFEGPWVGWDNFQRLFTNDIFLKSLRNTIAMSSLDIVFGTIFAVSLALAINEVSSRGLKRLTQTISYMPHFLSWVVAVNIIIASVTVDGGIVNEMLMFFRIIKEPINWLGNEKYFWFISTASQIWKETGWTAIIYLSAITSISNDLYEAAEIDGAGRLKSIFYITIPGLMPTIRILFIINLGNLMNMGFEKQLLLGNPSVINYAEVIDTYVLRYGMGLMKYSFATAAGLFKSVVGIILIIVANYVSKRSSGEGVF